MKVPFFHNNDDYDEVHLLSRGRFLQPRQHPSRHGHVASRRLHARPASQGAEEHAHAGEARHRRIRGDDRHARCARDRRRRPRRSNGPAMSTAGSRDEHMKLASLKRGGRDGRLVVVSRDLTRCVPVPGIAPTLQAALDDWEALAPRLAAARRGARSAARERGRHAVRPGAVCRAAAARLSLGRRQRLRQSRRAGAQGARRRDARLVLDRSAGLPGRLGRLARRRATTCRSATKPGASISRPRSP